MNLLFLQGNSFGFSPLAPGTLQEFLKKDIGIAGFWSWASLYGQYLHLLPSFLGKVLLRRLYRRTKKVSHFHEEVHISLDFIKPIHQGLCPVDLLTGDLQPDMGRRAVRTGGG